MLLTMVRYWITRTILSIWMTCLLRSTLILKRQQEAILFFFDPATYEISYFKIYSIHLSLGLDKVVVFRSFLRTPEQIYNLSHFKNEHAALFDKTTFYQLKDAASAVLAQEKSNSLAKLFPVELKFIIDTLKAWFAKIIKQKVFKIDYTKKQDFREENPVSSSTVCYLCDFPLVADSEKGWFDFVVGCE